MRDRQLSALDKMLQISSGISSSSFDAGNDDFSDQWKVLVYDKDCKDIISPLMNLGALRQKGVTLHLQLDTPRVQISDAPAVYSVRPTEENLKRIVDDCSKQLYRSFYLHFVTRIDRTLMEQFARDLVAAKATSAVTKIYDEYLDLISLEPGLFSLNMQDSFMQYNDASLSEAQIRAFINKTTIGLLSMVRTLGAIPLIRAPGGGAAEMLASELNKTLRESLSSRGPAYQLLSECLVSDRPRPLLLIFDRTHDLMPPLLHSSTYQALVDDLLDYRLNRVSVDVTTKGADSPTPSASTKRYDLNTQTDPFFGQYAAAAFPEAVEANEKMLADVSKREADIRSRPRGGAVAAQTALPADRMMAGEFKGASLGETDLSSAIESLPDILAKKKNLETHTNILGCVMKEIAKREIPSFFEVEQALLTTTSARAQRDDVISLLRDGSKGTLLDKARLLMLTAVLGDKAGYSAEFDSAFTEGALALVASVEQSQIDQILAAVAFVKRLQSLQSPMMEQLQAPRQSDGGAGAGDYSWILQQASSGASSLMAKAASFFTKFGSLYVTRVVEALSEGRSCPENDSFNCFDPRSRATDRVDFRGQKFSEVIVFVVGGGCYTEYFNLQELHKHKSATSPLRSIVYGCTELMKGEEFLSQLTRLGSPH
jgi:sec1 family domain-containing protein 1